MTTYKIGPHISWHKIINWYVDHNHWIIILEVLVCFQISNNKGEKDKNSMAQKYVISKQLIMEGLLL